MPRPLASRWSEFALRRPTIAQLLVFTVVNVGVTVLQLILMPVFKALFGLTALVDADFRAVPVGATADGSYYLFDYAAGPLPDGGGGLAYFLAVQLTLAIAQVINFFLQRSVTFRSNTNPWWAALWYALAYVVITIGAAALQGLYKAPVYSFLIGAMGPTGEAAADVLTMLINALISCAVFFPIFKLIFRRTETPEPEPAPVPVAAR